MTDQQTIQLCTVDEDDLWRAAFLAASTSGLHTLRAAAHADQSILVYRDRQRTSYPARAFASIAQIRDELEGSPRFEGRAPGARLLNDLEKELRTHAAKADS